MRAILAPDGGVISNSPCTRGDGAADEMTDRVTLRGWILYDDTCGVCRRFALFFENTLRRRGFSVVPLQSTWVVERLGLPGEELVEDLRLLLADGRQILGAQAYRYVMKRIWWAYPVFLLSIAPLLRSVFDWGYRMFAKHRYKISKTCGLPGFRGQA